jgi:hypothetical protein
MARVRSTRFRTYTQQEKVAFVSEIARRYPSEGRPLTAIADELGISASNYYNWTKAGIRPQPTDPPVAPSRYAPAERERIKHEVDRRRSAGMGIRAACREVGVSEKSYRKWRADAAPQPTLRPVAITALVPVTPAAITIKSELALVAPGGYRIEGLSVEMAAELLRALA